MVYEACAHHFGAMGHPHTTTEPVSALFTPHLQYSCGINQKPTRALRSKLLTVYDQRSRAGLTNRHRIDQKGRAFIVHAPNVPLLVHVTETTPQKKIFLLIKKGNQPWPHIT